MACCQGPGALTLLTVPRTVHKLTAGRFSHDVVRRHRLERATVGWHLARPFEEVRVLREVYTETTGRKGIPFTDEQRRRLAVKGKTLTPEEREARCHSSAPAPLSIGFVGSRVRSTTAPRSVGLAGRARRTTR